MLRWLRKKRSLQWDEIGNVLGSQLLSDMELITATAKAAFQGASYQDSLPDVDSIGWRQELSVFVMFWCWHVVKSPKLKAAGATRPMLSAYYHTCCRRLQAAGLVGDNSEQWERATHERWNEYAATWQQETQDDRAPAVFTGTVGWRFCTFLLPSQEPDPRFAMFMRQTASTLFLNEAKFIQSLEGESGTLR